jgi:hypothetical protein
MAAHYYMTYGHYIAPLMPAYKDLCPAAMPTSTAEAFHLQAALAVTAHRCGHRSAARHLLQRCRALARDIHAEGIISGRASDTVAVNTGLALIATHARGTPSLDVYTEIAAEFGDAVYLEGSNPMALYESIEQDEATALVRSALEAPEFAIAAAPEFGLAEHSADLLEHAVVADTQAVESAVPIATVWGELPLAVFIKKYQASLNVQTVIYVRSIGCYDLIHIGTNAAGWIDLLGARVPEDWDGDQASLYLIPLTEGLDVEKASSILRITHVLDKVIERHWRVFGPLGRVELAMRACLRAYIYDCFGHSALCLSLIELGLGVYEELGPRLALVLHYFADSAMIYGLIAARHRRADLVWRACRVMATFATVHENIPPKLDLLAAHLSAITGLTRSVVGAALSMSRDIAVAFRDSVTVQVLEQQRLSGQVDELAELVATGLVLEHEAASSAVPGCSGSGSGSGGRTAATAEDKVAGMAAVEAAALLAAASAGGKPAPPPAALPAAVAAAAATAAGVAVWPRPPNGNLASRRAPVPEAIPADDYCKPPQQRQPQQQQAVFANQQNMYAQQMFAQQQQSMYAHRPPAPPVPQSLVSIPPNNAGFTPPTSPRLSTSMSSGGSSIGSQSAGSSPAVMHHQQDFKQDNLQQQQQQQQQNPQQKNPQLQNPQQQNPQQQNPQQQGGAGTGDQLLTKQFQAPKFSVPSPAAAATLTTDDFVPGGDWLSNFPGSLDNDLEQWLGNIADSDHELSIDSFRQ